MDNPSSTTSGGSVFEEIRRQIEAMMTARQPALPRVLTTPAARVQQSGEGQAGVAMAATASYWLLALAAARRRRARLRAKASQVDPS